MSAFWGFPSSLTPSQSRALADLRSRWRRMSQPLDPDDPFWEVLVRPEGLSLPPPDGEAVDAAAAQADADWHLLRFLRARDFNVDKALVKMDQAARERERRGMKAWHDPGTARRIMLEPGAGVYACLMSPSSPETRASSQKSQSPASHGAGGKSSEGGVSDVVARVGERRHL